MIAHGWTNPVQVDRSGNVVAGHKRLAAAKVLGLREVPVVVLKHVDAAMRRRLVIADNKLSLKGRWNEPLLVEELHAVLENAPDLKLTGFDEDELRVLEERLEPPEPEVEVTNRTARTGRFTFTLIFDNEEQLERWHSFLTWLRDREYGKEGSTGSRVTRFIESHMARKS